MKIDKNKTKSIFFLSILLLLTASYFIYYQNEYINIIEDELSPSQKTITKNCKNFDKVLLNFNEYIFENFENSNNKPAKLEKIFIKTSEKSPILAFSSLYSFKYELSKDQINQINLNYKERIETKLFKLGLQKEYSYQNFNYLVIQFNQFEDRYVLEIPTNIESDSTLNYLTLRCGQIEEDRFRIYKKILSNFKETSILDILEYNDELLVLQINNLNIIEGKKQIFDLRFNKTELIYEGIDNIKCSLLLTKNLSKGIPCNE